MCVINKKLELAKEMYYFELEQREKLNTRTATPMAIITLLLGLAVFYFKGVKDIELNGWGWAFFTVYSVYIIFIFIAIVLVFKAYYNYKYSYLPKPEIIEKDINKIVAYYNSNYDRYFSNEGPKQDLIEKDIDDALYSYYKKATTTNIEMNEKKFRYLRLTGNFLLITLLFGGLSIIPYQFSIKDNQPTKVEIKSLDDISKKIDEGVNK
ncbi:hypothetical protein [Priestia megaterium]|uniref:hypothetical protein n=1 Tax=Priestia megaterium TaxID=1404 RepID=UPI00345AD1AB